MGETGKKEDLKLQALAKKSTGHTAENRKDNLN